MSYLNKRFNLKNLSLIMSIFFICLVIMTFFSTATVHAAATGAPAKPSLSHDNNDKDGNYTISMNMWWGNNATSWKLYENDVLILTENLVNNTPNAQKASKTFTNMAEGIYTYKCELINSHGTTTSSQLVVDVKETGAPDVEETGAPAKPSLSHDNNDKDGNYTISMNMWWGNNATSWKLYENDVLILTENLVNNTPNAQKASKTFTNMEDGTYTYKCELINSHGITTSSQLVVDVKETGAPDVKETGAPAKPSLSHDNNDKDGNYTISMNMWWGNNATSWKLYENDVLILTENLVNNTPNAQKASKTFTNMEDGTYTYKCELINSHGTTWSSPLVVEVNTKGTGDGPPANPAISIIGDPYGGLDFDVTWNIHSGQVADSWELYERVNDEYIKIMGPKNVDFTSYPQTDTYNIDDKVYGVYHYKIKVFNGNEFTWSNEMSRVVGGASKIAIDPKSVDVDKQALQFTQDQGTKSYSLSCNSEENASFIVSTNNDTVIHCSVEGTTLTVNGLKAGRASIKITETSTGEERYVGVRIKTSDGKLPGMPEYLAIGSVGTNVPRDINYVKDFQQGDKNKRMDIRYIYLNGEPDSWDRGVDGWQKWGKNIKGDRAITYIRENRKLGIIPFFVYYTICGANESYVTDLNNIQDAKYLSYYFKDLKFTLDTILEEAEDDLVGMIFEPDFLGYMMQNSGKQPNEIYANTKLIYEAAYGGEHAVGILDSEVDVDPSTNQPFADNINGLVRCINYLVNKYNTEHGTNIYFGWQFNLWANPYEGTPSNGLMHVTETMGMAKGREFIKARSIETANYYMAAGVKSFNADFISIDKYGQDAVAREPSAATDPAGSTWFFNADTWNNYLEYVKALHQTTSLPVVLWQMPVGHIERSQAIDPYDGGLFDELTNTESGGASYYEDSTTSFFFGDTFKPGASKRWEWFKTNESNDPLVTNNGLDTITWGSHFTAARDAGVSVALFGAGVGKATHGNVSDITQATKPEDDNWFFVKTQRYFKNPVPLLK